ncbi:uncharacterized protein DUF2848 [Litoreibacter meonggei]|uniref:Uncharacterized protein DUF2848 n=1 Tax=Litoreibacter meonggei TaxID=1049199 RepID=A0A497WTA9_9RHOB|nr:DUF2848 domain-containing protein [Litoreibacter meonggei]RLJ59947.1 uncharacterized protein DUF2848 [Litoreibacter meonggei]
MQFETQSGPLSFSCTRLVVAGWTGRDTAAVAHHIEELAAIGVPPPSTTPLYYRVSADLLTQATELQVLGPDSSGEAEPLLIQHDGALWLGLGSDHTDRALEATSVAASKQVCPKPVATALWQFDEVADRLDDLTLESWIEESGTWVPYQSGTLAAIRPLLELMDGAPMSDNTAMLCGTLGAIGGVRPAVKFKARLGDPHSGREIMFDYTAHPLPIIA